MSQDAAVEAHLAGHYAGVSDLESDFRNHNLFTLLAGEVTGERVVEIGSGPGYFAGMLAARGKQVTGIEPSGQMRALSQKLNPAVSVIAGSADELPALVSEPVNAIVMLDVLEHIKDDAAQVAKIRQALVPGGQFVCVVPAYPTLYGERDRLMGHYRRYTRGALRALLEGAGFHIERLRYWNALGVAPYFIAERILGKPLEAPLRHPLEKHALARLAQRALSGWFRLVENPIDFSFGLSIIAIATTPP